MSWRHSRSAQQQHAGSSSSGQQQQASDSSAQQQHARTSSSGQEHHAGSTSGQQLQFEDVGGGGVADDVVDDSEDVPVVELSAHPVHDHQAATSLAFQSAHLQALASKVRLSYENKQLQKVVGVSGAAVRERRGISSAIARHCTGLSYKNDFEDMLALQTQNITLAKKQMDFEEPESEEEASSASQLAATDQSATMVPLPLAVQGPDKVAWKLLTDASATEEQIDAVALLALSMKKRFDSRPDKTTHRLPVATAENNHRAVWLGGGGVGKTRTLCLVVEPLAVTYYGVDGYLATAQANHAAQNLGPRGRTLHAANGRCTQYTCSQR
jgi:hypothetical protein